MIGWKRDANGALVSTHHVPPTLDTHVYEVNFMDGSSKEHAANVIAEA